MDLIKFYLLFSHKFHKFLLRKVNLFNSEGSLWIFGGYSFTQGGPLNDIRAFDTKNVSWLPITVHFTADIPKERYFHAWELGMHSVENMVAEVTLHNNIEMSKKCKKMSKNCPKLPKIAQNCPKLKGYLSNYIFHTVVWF